LDGYYDLRTVQEGEPSILTGKPLRIVKAIEIGHIFKLGTKYSEALNARFLDYDGKEHPIIMGSYGIGVERILASFIEQNYDEKGIIWNKSLAPFTVHILTLAANKFENVKIFTDELYQNLTSKGIEVLYDNRNEAPGVKFNDADLIGMPIQIIVGNRGLEKGELEVKIRKSGERLNLSIDTFTSELQKLISQLD
jgi:prolyl-tRNA synthetase